MGGKNNTDLIVAIKYDNYLLANTYKTLRVQLSSSDSTSIFSGIKTARFDADQGMAYVTYAAIGTGRYFFGILD